MTRRRTRKPPTMMHMNAVLRAMTDKAVLVYDKRGNDAWLPRSVIELSNNYAQEGDFVKITLPQWLVKQRKLQAMSR